MQSAATQHGQQAVSLEFPADPRFLSLVRDCVEKGASLFGLTDTRLMGLTLAVEEIFLHLCQVSKTNEYLSLVLSSAPTGVDLRFTVKSGAIQLGGLNTVTADAIESLLDQEDFNQIGLLLAAGFIDHFSLKMSSNQSCILQLRQEREYPEPPVLQKKEQRSAVPPFHIVTEPSSQALQLACLQTTADYLPYLYTASFRYPGKFADLVLGNELAALILEDSMGAICGMVCWEMGSDKAVRFFGPYLYCNNSRVDIASQLVEQFIGSIARTTANIIFTTQVTDELPMQQFEPLGTLDYCTGPGQCVTLQACYRHLREDHGVALWCHPELEGFLRQEYDRLVLLRDIRLTRAHSSNRDDTSVFGLELNKESSLAIITPLLDGRNMADNLSLHVNHLVKREILNILFILDLGYGWQAAMAGELIKQGFNARLIEPLAGKADCVVFQYAAVQS